jgi:hypothetical protein
MKALSNTNMIEEPGRQVVVFSDAPCPAGSEYLIVDRSGYVLNVALAEQVSENNIPGARMKYIVRGKVVA